MSLPRVVAVAPGSPAARAGLLPGDELRTVGGQVPRDVIQFHLLTDEAEIELEVARGGLELGVVVEKEPGEPLGAEVHAALFDQVRTCDNHCEFCFIYQLPKGMRPSLYVKDDDYRLSFLYGNFTTLTRFTEADLERVVGERLSPLYVSIHATDPAVRARMLRNRRGATSLRWLRALLDHGVEVHGQVVVCPGVNDGAVLEDTLCGVLDRYPELATVAVVPLGVSRHSSEDAMRPHSAAEAAAVLDLVAEWQGLYRRALGRTLVFAADEYYLLAGRPFPPAGHYEGFPMAEDGIGLGRLLELQFGETATARPGGGLEPAGAQGQRTGGFFASVDAAPAEGYRAPRTTATTTPVAGDDAPVAVLTGEYGAAVLRPLLAAAGYDHVRIVSVANEFFGGNIGVTGLLTGADLSRALAAEPAGERYLLPDVCLSHGLFLDGMAPADLPRPVEVVPADGHGLRRALEGPPAAAPGGAARGPAVPVNLRRPSPAPAGCGGTP
jgi:putative radical SAM enzyme (TIGR03279 family)